MGRHRRRSASPLVEWSYRISLAAQGLIGLGQFVAGMGLLLGPQGSILHLVKWLTQNELASDPADPIASKLMAWASHLGPNVVDVYRFYLLGHGALNLLVVAMLLLRVRWAYGASLAVLVSFVCYQLFEFILTHDPALLAVTMFDLIVITLVLLERRESGSAEAPGQTGQPDLHGG